ncbi:hypothetical protein H5162_00080 [Pseudoalteromonas sp. SR41-8]|uniref:hypothetical protein n=1 Tax=Pseudoalteromonas sp. SR41-8 TaxID=2760946 RepID=UPI0016014F7E|nr:hypothetical protein [Pseudoalteromonas sp. SR41-8]MBB1307842.1 hypothetical protein [Pseudoalteromonas sp. SR41-8]
MEASRNSPNMTSNEKQLNLVCPCCSEESSLEYGKHITCNKCAKTFAGHTYKKFKKPLLTAKVALLIGAVGAYKLDRELLEPSRYSTGAIVEIVSFCSNPQAKISKNNLRVNARMCICALDETMKVVPEAELSSNKQKFINTFVSKLSQCR